MKRAKGPPHEYVPSGAYTKKPKRAAAKADTIALPPISKALIGATLGASLGAAFGHVYASDMRAVDKLIGGTVLQFMQQRSDQAAKDERESICRYIEVLNETLPGHPKSPVIERALTKLVELIRAHEHHKSDAETASTPAEPPGYKPPKRHARKAV